MRTVNFKERTRKKSHILNFKLEYQDLIWMQMQMQIQNLKGKKISNHQNIALNSFKLCFFSQIQWPRVKTLTLFDRMKNMEYSVCIIMMCKMNLLTKIMWLWNVMLDKIHIQDYNTATGFNSHTISVWKQHKRNSLSTQNIKNVGVWLHDR